MKTGSLKRFSRIMLVICGLALAVVLLVPVWRIDLSAPQYPEGLSLLICANGLKGDVAIVNGLNHYIGMKTLHSEDFFEFTLLPWIIIFFAAAMFAAAIAGRRKWLYAVFVLFVCFGVIAMVDFWRWEYDYGHNLNPDAPIVVPGMAYQPPLVGFRQLLNFGAWSMPGPGGWLFIGTGVALLLLVVLEWLSGKKTRYRINPAAVIVAVVLLVVPGSCTTGPEPIVTGRDRCDFCRMAMSDNRYGAEIVSTKGKVYKFDDTHCLLSFLQEQRIARERIKTIYVVDYGNNHGLIDAGAAFFLQSSSLRTPMGGNLAASGDMETIKKLSAEVGGEVKSWKEIYR